MGTTLLIAIVVLLFTTIVLLFLLSGEQWKAVEEKARARRMAEHKMNARLLRFNI